RPSPAARGRGSLREKNGFRPIFLPQTSFVQITSEISLNLQYFIDWQTRKGKQINLTGYEKTPVCLNEIRTGLGNQERL
ncbi:MAG: hypothetical protein ACJAVF_001120, partial [Paraglaciecola sp.]